MHPVILTALTRTAARRVMWSILRALAAAAVAGLGFRLGAEAYEVARRRVPPPPPYDPEKADRP